MRYTKTTFQSYLVVTFQGEFTASTAGQLLMQELADEMQMGVRKVIFDMAEVFYVNSSGIRLLLQLQQVVQKQGGQLAITNLSGDLTKILIGLKIIGLFQRYGSVEDACRAMN